MTMSTRTTAPASAAPPPAPPPCGAQPGWSAGRVVGGSVRERRGAHRLGLAARRRGTGPRPCACPRRRRLRHPDTQRLSPPTDAMTVEDIDLGTEPVDFV